MKTKFCVIAFVLIFSMQAVVANAQTATGIRIVRGNADTVRSALLTVVGHTFPGSNIQINGKEAKQYRTGSFGAEVELVPGDNEVVVKSLFKGNEYLEKFHVFYSLVPVEKKEGKEIKFDGKSVITLPGAYLNYGTGEDRLGGAKINFIDKEITMELMDSVNNLYKVKLSENNYAYIPKELVRAGEPGTAPSFSLTGSWNVSNAGGIDVVKISLQGRQPYTVEYDWQNNSLLVDIYGAVCNSNWITQYLDLKAIDFVDFVQREPDVFRVVIKFKNRYSWGYDISYQGTSLAISVKHPPLPQLKGLVVGVDAGHGGSASGAVSPSGVREKELNLAMAYMLKEELEKRGAIVVMSRKEDIDMTMAERKAIFSKENIDLLVSIHCNGGSNPLASGGTSTYYRHLEYRNLAKSVLGRLLEIPGVKNSGLVGNFNFSLNAPTAYPSVLVETLFMSSLPDEEMIIDPKFQREMMLKVVKGLEDYLKLVKKSN